MGRDRNPSRQTVSEQALVDLGRGSAEPAPASARLRHMRRRPFGPRVVLAVVMAVVTLGASALAIGPAGADALSDKRAEAARVAAKLAELDARAMQYNGQYEAARFELRQAEERVAAARALSAQTAAEAEQRRTDLRRYAVVAYQNGNDSPGLDALLTNDAETGVQKRSYLETISGSRQDLVDALTAAKQKADEDAVRLEVAEDAAAAKKAEIEQLKVAADQAAAEQRAINARVQGELRVLVEAENARRAREAELARQAAAARSGVGRGVIGVANPPAPGAGGPGAIRAGMTKLGSGYLWGAEGPDVFDCSGFVRWSYLQVGISLPHYSGAMYNMTVRISQSQLQPGDLVFWGPSGSAHVAIYIGGNQILHTARGVSVTPLDWWTGNPPSGFGRIVTR